MEWEFDENGNLIYQSMYGIKGEPAAFDNGVSYLYIEYDSEGNKITETGYDINGEVLYTTES